MGEGRVIKFDVGEVMWGEVIKVWVAWRIRKWLGFWMFLLGGKTPILNLAKMEDDPQRRKPDITRARTQLGWEPKVTQYSIDQDRRTCLFYVHLGFHVREIFRTPVGCSSGHWAAGKLVVIYRSFLEGSFVKDILHAESSSAVNVANVRLGHVLNKLYFRYHKPGIKICKKYLFLFLIHETTKKCFSFLVLFRYHCWLASTERLNILGKSSENLRSLS